MWEYMLSVVSALTWPIMADSVLNIHSVLNRHGGEGMAQVVEAHLLALCTFKDGLKAVVEGAGVARLPLVDG